MLSSIPGAVPASRTLLTLFLFGSALACQTREQDTSPETSPGESPSALVDRWVVMWNDYDLDRVGDLFLDGPGLTYFSSEREGVIRGMESLLEHHRGFGFVPGGEERPNRLWVEGLEEDLFGEVAVLTGIWFFQSDAGSPEEPQKGPVTFVCVRVDESWRFVHMNFSEYAPPEDRSGS